MESENVDTEPSLQMHKLPSVCPFFFVCVCVCGGGGGLHSAQGTTQFVDHKLTSIIQKELQSLIKYFVILIIAFLFLCMPATARV